MNAAQLVRRLHQHRIWANGRLLAAARQLSPDQLRQPMTIGQGSVWRTLAHLQAAEYVWLAALEGDENPLFPGDARGQLPGNQQADGAAATFDELTTRWTQLDGRWNDYLAGLTDQTLDQVIYKTSTSFGAGVRHATRAADILLHVCTHAQYTSAQLVNMLRQLGQIDLPDIMLITLAREEPASKQA